MVAKISTKVDVHDLSTLFLCSMRYAIGRHTYMPSLVLSIINMHKDSLLRSDKEMLAEAIRSELNSMSFFSDPDSVNKKIKLDEKLLWEELVLDLLEE